MQIGISGVAFTAAMGPGYDRDYSTNTRVSFPVVITNVGGGYDAATNVFTCPRTGVYLFNVAILSQRNELGVVDIVVNGVQKFSAYADGRANTWDHASNGAVLECKQGQKVWVQTHSNSEYQSIHTQWNYGTFSGMLLR